MPCVIEAMEWQQEVIFCACRFICLMAGRRAGKTDAIKARIKVRTQRPNFKYLYIAPLSFQSLIVYRELMADSSWRPFIKSSAQRPYPQIILRNGSRIVFRSFQRPDGIKSTGEDEICLDESQDPKITEYDVDTVIMPMLGDFRGTLLMAGQFRGEDWRYNRFWLPGQKPNRIFKSWRIPSSEGYVFKAPGGADELALLKSTVPAAVWEQEFDCIPRANANACYSEKHIDAISTKFYPPVKNEMHPERGGGYAALIDLGGKHDPLALIIGHESGDIVFAKQWPLGMEDKPLARQAMEIARFFNAIVVVDSTAGGKPGVSVPDDKRVEFYRKDAALFKLEFQDVYQTTNKDRLVINLGVAIQQKEIRICPELKDVLDQLKWYECIYNPNTRTYKYSAPRGKHDDFVSCCMTFVETLARGWIKRASGGRPYRAN